MSSIVPCIVTLLLLSGVSAPVLAQGTPTRQLSPKETVLAFYKALREQRYMEGFAYSVYREAVEPLSRQDFAELIPDFAATFSEIPREIKIAGEQISGETATVFVQLGGKMEQVPLVQDQGRWLVGDREALLRVRAEGAEFLINARIHVNQGEVFELTRQLVGAQDSWYAQKKAYATLQELIVAENLADEFNGASAVGYKFSLQLAPDKKSFTISAVPEQYGRTGRLSFFSDGKRIHGDDARGAPIDETAPVMLMDSLDPESGKHR
jgi:hypothetical protein